MSEQENIAKSKTMIGTRGNDGGGFIWILGAIGAAVYYVPQAETFGQGALGILKALVWPAILTYKVIEHLSQ
jgi:hypothetical protein